MIHVPIDTALEGPIIVRIVQDANRDAGATAQTLTLKWLRADETAYTTLTVTTHYTVTEATDGLYRITLESSLFDTVGCAVLKIECTTGDEYYERFWVYTPANLSAHPATLADAEWERAAEVNWRIDIADLVDSTYRTLGTAPHDDWRWTPLGAILWLIGKLAPYNSGAQIEVSDDEDTVLYRRTVVSTVSSEDAAFASELG